MIITTDHGNANPGIIYGRKPTLGSIHKYTQTNEWILNQIKADSSVSQVQIIEKSKWP
jgi:alkaline phosphatase